MQVTIFSFFMAILWCSLFVLLAALLEHDSTFIQKYGMTPVMAVMVLGIARLAIPVEPPHSKVIGSNTVIPAIQHFLLNPCYAFHAYVICWGDIFIAVWVLGCVLVIVRFLIQTFQTNRWLRNLRPLDDHSAAEVLESIVSASKPMQKYRLIVTNEVQTPMLIGFFEPVILLPPLELSKDELFYVLLHEWSHFLHKDLWKKLLIDFICAFLWWNPIVYIIKKNFDYALEINCDRYVVRNGNPADQIRYVEAIVKVMRQMLDRTKDSLQPSIPFVTASDQNMVTQRCELILYTPQKMGNQIILPLACALTIVLFSYIFIIQPRTPAPLDSGTSVTAGDAYIVQQKNGRYVLYVDGKLQGNIPSEDISKPPFSDLTIKGEESEK